MAKDSTTTYQLTSLAPEEASAEIRLRCSDWRQARRLQRRVMKGEAMVARLAGEDGTIQLSLELPDGHVLPLRAYMTGRMVDQDGALEGVLVHVDLDERGRAELELVTERAALVRTDAARLAALAESEGDLLRPQGLAQGARGSEDHSGIHARPEPPHDDQNIRDTCESVERPSQRPTVPDALLEDP